MFDRLRSSQVVVTGSWCGRRPSGLDIDRCPSGLEISLLVEIDVGIAYSLCDVPVDVCVVRFETCSARRVLSHLLHEPGPTCGGVDSSRLGYAVFLEVTALRASYSVPVFVEVRLADP